MSSGDWYWIGSMEALPDPVNAPSARERILEPLRDLLSSRVPLWLVMWFGLLFKPTAAPTNAFLSGWFKWDAGWYMRIADVGYSNLPDALGHRDTAFWPLFPLLLRGVQALVPHDGQFFAAFVLNHLLLFGALVLFRDVAEWSVGKERGALSSWLLLSHPFAFFYSAAYSESCFLFFSLLCFHFGLRRRWLVAGLAAACASATRAAGIGVTAALAVLYLEECGWSLRRIRWNALCVPLGALGALEYMALLELRFHDPFAFMNSMTARDWGVDMTWARFTRTLGALVTPWRAERMSWIQAVDVIHILCLGVAFAATIAAIRRLRPYLVVFCAVDLFLIVQVWSNGGRYVAPLFPVYLVLATWLEKRPHWTRFAIAFSLSFQAVLAVLYGHRDWVG